MEQRPIIALVGRPNVGKSTIFNRLIGRRQAITSHIPGTTRDRHFGVARWFSHAWTIVDTAGVLFDEEEEQNLAHKQLQAAMEEQVDVAVEEAQLIAVVVDIKADLHTDDEKLIRLLRKHNKPLVVLANKADNAEFRTQADIFHRLGIQDVFAVSAVHGTGMGDFVDFLIKTAPSPDEASSEVPKLAFIGRPNVGKSTLVNRILGEKRMVVSATPGTTRDSVTSDVTIDDATKFVLIDTAGIRRRGKIEEGIEKFSLFRSLKAINQSDIVVLLLTIEEAPTRGDAHVAMYAEEAGKKIILGLNKADLAAQAIFKLSNKERKALAGKFLKRFAFLQRKPIVFVSAQTGQGVNELIDTIKTELTSH